MGIGVLPQARREVQGGMRNLSAQQMVITANDLKDAGIGVPLLVGALSAEFTVQKIAPSHGGAGVLCEGHHDRGCGW